jgi:hypothetical protein
MQRMDHLLRSRTESDPLETLELVVSPTRPALKNEMMLPAVLGT